ncbi:hypothetical protein [Fibrobacter succinogenes]|uniref:hypothetical protein n=1 Tax=Fibrobacter succinogenes TaxID=833 RepID=UPI00156613AF|nr:hypothetical protein [Fibrobacter succinogenes]
MKNPFEAFKSYMVDARKEKRSSGADENLWWFSPNVDEFSKLDLDEEKFASSLVNSKVKFWNRLSPEERRKIRVEMLVAAPDVVEGNYEYACQWLLQTKGVVCPSFRDIFSAGGRTPVNDVNVPQVIGKINEWKKDIAATFNARELPRQSFEHWKCQVLSSGKFAKKEMDVLEKIVDEIGRAVLR